MCNNASILTIAIGVFLYFCYWCYYLDIKTHLWMQFNPFKTHLFSGGLSVCMPGFDRSKLSCVSLTWGFSGSFPFFLSSFLSSCCFCSIWNWSRKSFNSSCAMICDEENNQPTDEKRKMTMEINKVWVLFLWSLGNMYVNNNCIYQEVRFRSVIANPMWKVQRWVVPVGYIDC